LKKKERVFGAAKGKGCKGRVFWIFGEDNKDWKQAWKETRAELFCGAQELQRHFQNLSKGTQVRGALRVILCLSLNCMINIT